MMTLPPKTNVPNTKGIAVFCGAREDVDPLYLATARDVGQAIAERNLRIVYGGGGLGLMGHLASGALQAGGYITGVIPESMVTKERAHPRVGDMRIVQTMHERKALITAHADAFLALPGGVGTLDELFEAITWRQLGIHNCPIAILNVDGFYNELWASLQALTQRGFIAPETLESVHCSSDIESILGRFAETA